MQPSFHSGAACGYFAYKMQQLTLTFSIEALLTHAGCLNVALKNTYERDLLFT